jgi:archaemetzincin
MKLHLIFVFLICVACTSPNSPADEGLFHKLEEEIEFQKFKWSTRNKLNKKRNKVFLVKIGDFNELENAWFLKCQSYISKNYQLVVLKNSFSFESIKNRKNDFGTQYAVKDIFDKILIAKLPKNSISFLAVCNQDIYPDESFNYCFGKASFNRQVAVVSMKRFLDAKDYDQNISKYEMAFFKTITHEIGHNLQLKHCELNRCNMNAINDMKQALQQQENLCDVCQRKKNWAIK